MVQLDGKSIGQVLSLGTYSSSILGIFWLELIETSHNPTYDFPNYTHGHIQTIGGRISLTMPRMPTKTESVNASTRRLAMRPNQPRLIRRAARHWKRTWLGVVAHGCLTAPQSCSPVTLRLFEYTYVYHPHVRVDDVERARVKGARGRKPRKAFLRTAVAAAQRTTTAMATRHASCIVLVRCKAVGRCR